MTQKILGTTEQNLVPMEKGFVHPCRIID